MIGMGEAGRAFADAPDRCIGAAGFDVNPALTRAATLAEALDGAEVVLSLVTADRSVEAARQAAAHLACRAFFLDMNSVAPQTKRAACADIEAAGGRYIDVAIMAPVIPARLHVPLAVSGPHAAAADSALRAAGFSNVRIVADSVGAAAAIKMIRSVMIKGIEALTAEMIAAGDAAGVTEEVLASLGGDWASRAAYNLDRMRQHGTCRAAEMREVAATLDALGIEPVMTRGTIRRQAEMGAGSAARLKDAA